MQFVKLHQYDDPWSYVGSLLRLASFSVTTFTGRPVPIRSADQGALTGVLMMKMEEHVHEP